MARLPTTSPSRRRRASIELVEGRDHYEKVVLEAICRARVSVWIATANVKDVHVEAPLGSTARARGRFVSILERLSDLVKTGVDVRILHGGTPSRAFSDSLAKLRGVKGRGFEMRRCPRVHLKLVAVDGAYLYLGSANFTGAGLGAKGEGRRNFELGIDTDDDLLLDAAQLQFDRIWNGRECASCRLRDQCPAPLDGGANAKRDDPRRVSAARRPRAAKARRA